MSHAASPVLTAEHPLFLLDNAQNLGYKEKAFLKNVFFVVSKFY